MKEHRIVINQSQEKTAGGIDSRFEVELQAFGERGWRTTLLRGNVDRHCMHRKGQAGYFHVMYVGPQQK